MYAFECFPEKFSFGEPICTGSSEVNAGIELESKRGLVERALVVADSGVIWPGLIIMPYRPFVV